MKSNYTEKVSVAAIYNFIGDALSSVYIETCYLDTDGEFKEIGIKDLKIIKQYAMKVQAEAEAEAYSVLGKHVPIIMGGVRTTHREYTPQEQLEDGFTPLKI